MKTKDVKIGGMYVAKISGTMTIVRLDQVCSHGGWIATNMITERKVNIRTAAKLRREASLEENLLNALGLKHVPARHGFAPGNQVANG